MDDEINEGEFNLTQEVTDTLAAVADHDYQTILGIKGILDGSLTEGLDLDAEQRIALIEEFLVSSAIARKPIAERMMLTAMMFD